MTRLRHFLGCFLTFQFASLGMAQMPPAPAEPKPSLAQLSGSFEELVRRTTPSVVELIVSSFGAVEESGEGIVATQRGSGSGIIVDPSGYIVTNSHVVRNAVRVRVLLSTPPPGQPRGRSILKPKGASYEGKIVGIDPETDLAVVKIEGGPFPAIRLGNSDAVRQGQIVLAFGSPRGLDNSVSMGIVSSVARQIQPDAPMVYIQTDAPINPGNSGGPLVNADGQVVGINTFILTESGGSEGLGFSIPSNIVRNVYRQIKASGHVHRGEIGAGVQTITPALAEGLNLPVSSGVIVSDVNPDSPANSAGLKIGDVIVRLDGKLMENARQFEVNMYRRQTGEKASLEIRRGEETLTVPVEVIERAERTHELAAMVSAEKNLVPKLGILGIEIDKKVAEMLPYLRGSYGVVVAARAPDPRAVSAGLEPGDVIHAINGLPVATVAALRSAMESMEAGASTVLQVERQGRFRFLAFQIE